MTIKLIFSLFLGILLSTHNIMGQVPTIQWQKSFGGSAIDELNSIQQTNDGGYIVAGYTNSNNGDITNNHGNFDYWVLKIDVNGNLQWQKTLGGSSVDEAYSVQQTSDGGYVVMGRTNSNDGDVSGNHGNYDYWIVKLDTNGTLQWQKTLGGTNEDYGYSVIQTSEGGYIITGDTWSNNGDVSGNHGNGDFWVIKLDSNGNIQWKKALGGSGYESCYSVKQTSDSGYIVTGSSDSNNGDVSGNHGGTDYWIVKLDTNGTIQWQKSLGGSGNDVARSTQQTFDGGYIVVGRTNSNDNDVSEFQGYYDSWIVKLDVNGSIQWQNSLGGTGFESSNSVQQHSDGGYIVAGLSDSNNGDVTGNHGNTDCWVVKLDINGAIQWQKSLGGTSGDVAFSIQQTSDGGYIVGGQSYSNNGDVTGNHGSKDYWVVKLENSTMGTIDFLKNDIIIYPNPFNDEIRISLKDNQNYSVKIINTLGQELKSFNIQHQEGLLSVAELNSGVYFMNFYNSENKLVNTKKIIKKQ